jgi:hypothetical protein
LKVLTALSLASLTLFSGCRRSPEGKTEVQGDTATVYATAKGATNLENRNIKIRLVREDNWWKATAGIKE